MSHRRNPHWEHLLAEIVVLAFGAIWPSARAARKRRR